MAHPGLRLHYLPPLAVGEHHEGVQGPLDLLRAVPRVCSGGGGGRVLVLVLEESSQNGCHPDSHNIYSYYYLPLSILHSGLISNVKCVDTIHWNSNMIKSSYKDICFGGSKVQEV